MKNATLSGLALLVCSSVLLLGWPISAATAQDNSFEMVPGVVVDRAADALYLMSPGGGVERISLSSGSVSWKSEEAGKPIALYDGLLMAQAEKPGLGKQLDIVLLETQGGRVVQELQVELPEGVVAGIDDGLGRKFITRGLVQGGVPMVTWEQTMRYSSGAAPGPGESLQSSLEAAYRVDLQASRLVAIESAAAAFQAPTMPASVRNWRASGAAAEPAALTGAVFAATEVSGGSTTSSSRVSLKRWDSSGQSLPDLEIFRGPHVLQLRSADGLHLLVAERAAPSDAEEYEWSVFSLETGERVGQLRHRQSHSRFFVSGQTLVLIEDPFGLRVDDQWVLPPRRLHAVVLDSGSTVWEQPLRDTSFKGQVPP